jgi:hypothetical protein
VDSVLYCVGSVLSEVTAVAILVSNTLVFKETCNDVAPAKIIQIQYTTV